MTTLPGPLPPQITAVVDSTQSSNFGQLVQRIVQSNSGKHKALIPVPRKEKELEDHWDEFRTKAERAQASGNLAHAEAMWLKAIAESHAFEERDWRRGFALDSLAGLYFAEGRFDEAEVFAVRALECMIATYGTEDVRTADCEMFLSCIFFNLLKTDEAITYAESALSVYESVLNEWHSKVATACYNLAVIYHSFGEFEEAESYYQRAFKIRAEIFGFDHPMTRRVADAYTEMTIDRQHYKEAKEMLDRLIGPAA